MKSIQIKPSLFFMLHSYFVHGSVEYHDEITKGLEEKMEKMLLHKLYTDSKKAPTEEERELAMQEYLKTVGKVRAKALLDISD